MRILRFGGRLGAAGVMALTATPVSAAGAGAETAVEVAPPDDAAALAETPTPINTN